MGFSWNDEPLRCREIVWFLSDSALSAFKNSSLRFQISLHLSYIILFACFQLSKEMQAFIHQHLLSMLCPFSQHMKDLKDELEAGLAHLKDLRCLLTSYDLFQTCSTYFACVLYSSFSCLERWSSSLELVQALRSEMEKKSEQLKHTNTVVKYHAECIKWVQNMNRDTEPVCIHKPVHVCLQNHVALRDFNGERERECSVHLLRS